MLHYETIEYEKYLNIFLKSLDFNYKKYELFARHERTKNDNTHRKDKVKEMK